MIQVRIGLLLGTVAGWWFTVFGIERRPDDFFSYVGAIAWAGVLGLWTFVTVISFWQGFKDGDWS